MFFRKQSFKFYVKINFVNVANLYALRVILCVVYSQANTVSSYENKKNTVGILAGKPTVFFMN